MPAGEASGVWEADGTSATGGAPTGLLTGATAGVSAAGGGVAWDGAGGGDPLLEGLEAGEIGTEDGGWAAGDFAVGADAGDGGRTDPDGETSGVCEGGDKVGDFAGDALWFAGECAGGFAVEGGFAGDGDADDLGEGEGAFSAWTETEDVKNSARRRSGRKLLFIFGVLEEYWKSTRMNDWTLSLEV